jgi:hypothetical protein
MHSSKREFFALLAVVAAALAGPSAAESAGGMIRASCVDGERRSVYRGDLPADATADRRLAIAAKYPEAMCVFLKIADLPPEYRVPNPVAGGELPADVLNGATSGGQAPDESLAAALSVLTGKGGGPRGGMDVGGPAPAPFSNAWSQPMTSDPAAATRQKPVNLTIGIYKGVAMDDVVAHWKAMQQGTKMLSRMTPNMTVTGNVTMLSIEDVQDSDAAAVCDEAAKVGSGCIAFY